MPRSRSSKFGNDAVDVSSQLAQIVQQTSPKQITTKGHIYSNASNSLSNGTDTGLTYRLKYTVTSKSYNISFVFGNFYDIDVPNPDDITVKASVEVGGIIYPIKFHGSDQITLKGGGLVTSDPIGIEVNVGDVIWVRNYVSVSAVGKKWVLGRVVESALGEGTATGDLTTSGTITPATAYAYSPIAIVGATSNKSILLIGDSILYGMNDTGFDNGFAVRAIGSQFGYINMAKAGHKASEFKGLGRYLRMVLTQYGTHAIVQYGINDLNTGGTVSQIKTDLQNIWNILHDRGIKVHQTTITPKTTSTDSWATTTNQTKTSFENLRVELNEWIRTKPVPLVDIFDTADSVETTRNSGIWKAGYTNDGIHPTAAGHTAMSNVIDLSKLN